MTISKDDIVVLAGLLTRKSIEERCEQLRAGVEMGSPDYMIKIRCRRGYRISIPF